MYLGNSNQASIKTYKINTLFFVFYLFKFFSKFTLPPLLPLLSLLRPSHSTPSNPKRAMHQALCIALPTTSWLSTVYIHREYFP